MKKLFLSCLFLTWLLPAASQVTVKGLVKNRFDAPISGAKLSFGDSGAYVLTDSLGTFAFTQSVKGKFVIVSHPTYLNDTVRLDKRNFYTIVLNEFQTITGVKVKAESEKNLALKGISSHTEVIGQGDLKKTACCDLAGCFETQGTVQPMTTNIITNAKELRILGLSGVYNQVLTEGIPMMYGLAYTYGISSFPGTLIDNIFVSKGTNSVLQGFESVVGQVNVIPKSPDRSEKFLYNSYINSFGENQHNLNYRIGKGKWNNLTSIHVVQPASKWDRDKDEFLDLPLLQRYLVYNKLKYGDEYKGNFYAILGLKAYNEIRYGGQWNFNPTSDLGSVSVYGQSVKFNQFDGYFKAGYKLNEDRRISWMNSAQTHDQNSWFGSVNYRARQFQAYSNLQFEQNWNGSHEFKSGVSLRVLNMNERISFSDTTLKRTYAGTYIKKEMIPGVFAENTFKWRGDIITLITGVRADHHNLFGWKVTPRAMLKYDVTDKAIMRMSAGTGWRTVNLFSENIGLLVSSRDIVFKEPLKEESAFNWGVNFLQRFKKKHFEGFFTIDFYQTRFQNQFFPDYDSEPTKALIYNFSGHSISNGFQTDWNVKVKKLVELKAAYNFLDVYRIINSEKYILPFNAKHKLLIAVSYLPKSKKWRADVNVHWFGKQRLPDTENYPELFRQSSQSKSYTTFNLQLTKTWKKFEFYGGCENIFDYRQLRPIVSWQDPNSPYFDTSFNWGPTRGREAYIGFRYIVK